jgi:hypothetical protein
MNTSIATLSIQYDDEISLYLEGKRVKPQCFSCHEDTTLPRVPIVTSGLLRRNLYQAVVHHGPAFLTPISNRGSNESMQPSGASSGGAPVHGGESSSSAIRKWLRMI